VRTLHWLPEECAYLEYVNHIDTLEAVRVAGNARKKGRGLRRRR
jgi:uncharacterized cysteine cluster protein YcgN (CxxCxxCC family)